jgi:hypothetical protein
VPWWAVVGLKELDGLLGVCCCSVPVREFGKSKPKTEFILVLSVLQN